MTQKFWITADALDEHSASACLDAEGVGGVTTFVGRVRASSRGRQVTMLEYEAYPEMAERVFSQIASEAKAMFEIRDIVIHHRVGNLSVGETSVVISVSAPHRAAAFDACRYAIDRLKQIAPIWKKEHYHGGAVWIDDRP
jgi:molybdopterin synthase catalytic subunit